MRPDMSKVIVERARRPGHLAKGKGRLQDSDMQVSHEGMRAPHVRHWGGKELNENLSPLRGFLRSRVGQVWNDVFSEICAHIRLTSTVQKHVRDHIAQMVATKIWIDHQGEPWDCEHGPRQLSRSPYIKFWVDPADGILKTNTAKTGRQQHLDKIRLRRAQEAGHSRSLPGGIELRKSQGIWYQVTMAPIPEITERSYTYADGRVANWQDGGSAYDVISQTQVHRSRYRNGISTYCADKRQLNRAELRHYQVTND
jgi:hypothetical protein